MTAILVSTAVSLIRLRVRLERVQHEVITRELSQARQIQLNWLPNRHTAGPALDIAAINQPASHISGDFYNWFDLPDGRQVITIGDVTGHGMAAAFLMATTQLLVRTTMARVGDPGACMEEVNRQLCTQVFHGQFVTMLIVVLDLEHSQLELATAGHAAPLISEGGGPFRELDTETQLVLGMEPDDPLPHPAVRPACPRQHAALHRRRRRRPGLHRRAVQHRTAPPPLRPLRQRPATRRHRRPGRQRIPPPARNSTTT